MAYNSGEKRKTVQEEMTYIVYMIISGYFNKATCKNPFVMSRLFLHYAEMRNNAQIVKEEKIIAKAEKALKDYLPVLGVMNCEVVIRFSNDMFLLDFITGFEQVHAEVDRNGNCTITI